MAARMEGQAARHPDSRLGAEWTSLASYWRDLARQADWQDRYAARSP